MKDKARRAAIWFRTRYPLDDRGNATSEILMWTAGGLVIIVGLLVRFTAIFDGVADQVENTLLGGG